MGSCAVRQKPKDENLPLAGSRFLQVAEDRWSPAFTETPEICSYFVDYREINKPQQRKSNTTF